MYISYDKQIIYKTHKIGSVRIFTFSQSHKTGFANKCISQRFLYWKKSLVHIVSVQQFNYKQSTMQAKGIYQFQFSVLYAFFHLLPGYHAD